MDGFMAIPDNPVRIQTRSTASALELLSDRAGVKTRRLLPCATRASTRDNTGPS